MINMPKDLKRRLLQNRIYIYSLVAVVALAGFLAYAQPGIAYEVSVNGNTVGIVKRPSQMKSLLKTLDIELRETKGQEITYDIEVEYTKGKLNGNDLSDIEDLKINTVSSLDIKSPGYLIKSDGKILMAVKDETIAENVLEAIKTPFLNSRQNARVEFLQEVNVVRAERISVGKILNTHQALAVVKSPISVASVSRSSVNRDSSNESNGNQIRPLIDVKVTYEESVNIPIYRAEKRVADSSMTQGTTRVTSEGENGVKEVLREVVEVNGEEVEKITIREEVIKEPQPKIVAYGTKPKTPSVVAIARNYIGVPYRWGGTTPSGFDCSGFTQYVFRKAGVNLPRTSAEQGRVGTRVSRSELRPGDLVYFPGHIGIYVGNGQFIHSPSPGKRVTIDSLSSRRNFLYGRRVL